jgi:hypothetical protein
MRNKNRALLGVEQLEERLVPATARLVNGFLFVSKPTFGGSGLVVKAVAANTFQVTDNGANVGTFMAGGGLFITGSNAADVITLNLQGQTFGGNLFINAANGNDLITVLDTVGGGTIGGNTIILPGFGNDLVSLNPGLGAMHFGGNVTLVDTLGIDALTLGNGLGPTTVGGDVNVIGFNNIGVGAGQPDSIGGNLTVQSALEGTPVAVTLGTAGQGITVGRSLTVNTGPAADTVVINGNGATGTAIQGNVNVNLGNGNNSFNVAGSGVVVGGLMNVLTGTGNDVVAFAGGALFEGNVNLNVGEGANDLSGLNSAFAVSGDLAITAGNGSNAAFTMNGTVAGNLRIMLGNGANGTVTVAQPVDGRLVWRSGNGPDSLTLTGQGFYNVLVNFGNNDDMFTLNIGAGNVLTGFVDGGGRLTANSFAQLSGQLGPIITISNFP